LAKTKKQPDELTFLEHLEELRKRLFLSFVAVIIAAVPSWFFSKDIYEFLEKPVKQYLPSGEKLVYTKLPAPFFLYLKVSFLTAIFAASPFIFYQLWHFISPGLYKKEKKYVVPFVASTTFFFIAGALFAYFIAFPFACHFFLKIGEDFTALLTIDEYFSLVLRVVLGMALVFELPTIVFFLAKLGVITAAFLIKNFKYAVLAIFVIAAIITPTPDWFMQSIVAAPLLILYGISILITLLVGKRSNVI
jgi:sec-independent protein translocase protein TatC